MQTGTWHRNHCLSHSLCKVSSIDFSHTGSRTSTSTQTFTIKSCRSCHRPCRNCGRICRNCTSCRRSCRSCICSCLGSSLCFLLRWLIGSILLVVIHVLLVILVLLRVLGIFAIRVVLLVLLIPRSIVVGLASPCYLPTCSILPPLLTSLSSGPTTSMVPLLVHLGNSGFVTPLLLSPALQTSTKILLTKVQPACCLNCRSNKNILAEKKRSNTSILAEKRSYTSILAEKRSYTSILKKNLTKKLCKSHNAGWSIHHCGNKTYVRNIHTLGHKLQAHSHLLALLDLLE